MQIRASTQHAVTCGAYPAIAAVELELNKIDSATVASAIDESRLDASSHLVPTTAPEEVCLVSDDNHIMTGSRRRRAAACLQPRPLVVAISIPVSRSVESGLLNHLLLHIASHTVYCGALSAHAVGSEPERHQPPSERPPGGPVPRAKSKCRFAEATQQDPSQSIFREPGSGVMNTPRAFSVSSYTNTLVFAGFAAPVAAKRLVMRSLEAR